MKDFQEEYQVKFSYKKHNGFYTTTTETVYVPIKDYEKEKCSHHKAEQIIKDRNLEDLVIINVKYCWKDLYGICWNEENRDTVWLQVLL